MIISLIFSTILTVMNRWYNSGIFRCDAPAYIALHLILQLFRGDAAKFRNQILLKPNFELFLLVQRTETSVAALAA